MEPGECDNCHNPSRYTCPACYKHSCSLNCVRTHKAKYDCSGKVDPTRFIPKPELLTAHSLDRDYNFLQQIGREIVVNKNDSKSFRVYKPRDSWRAGARVHHMAKGMSRSVKNKSHWDNQRKQFVWTVEVINMLYGTGSDRKIVQLSDQTMIQNIPLEAGISTGEKMWIMKLLDSYCNELVLSKEDTLQQAVKGRNVLEFPTLVLAEEVKNNDSDSDSSSDSSSDDSSGSSDSSDSDSDSSDSDAENGSRNSSGEIVKTSNAEKTLDGTPVESACMIIESVNGQSSDAPLVSKDTSHAQGNGADAISKPVTADADSAETSSSGGSPEEESIRP